MQRVINIIAEVEIGNGVFVFIVDYIILFHFLLHKCQKNAF